MLGLFLAIMTHVTQSHPGKLAVVNQYDHSVSIVDLSNHSVLGKVSVGVNGHELTASKDGRFVYVPIYSNVVVGQAGTDGNHIDVVDIKNLKVDRSINLGMGVRPHAAHFNRDGLLYVTAELDKAIYAVDTHSDKVVAKIPSGHDETHMFVLSKDGHKAYTSNINSGTVSVLDLQKHTLLSVIPVARVAQRISMSADGRWVFTHDQDKPRAVVIDTKTDKVAEPIDLPGVAFSSDSTPDGKWLLVLCPGAQKLVVIDAATHKIEKTIDMPKSSMALYIRPGGETVYISCIGTGEIAILNLKTWEMEPSIKLSPGVDGMAWVQ